MNGVIELGGIRVGELLYPWNSSYNINNTMLFQNSWSRISLDKVVGMSASFRLWKSEIWSPIILDESGNRWQDI